MKKRDFSDFRNLDLKNFQDKKYFFSKFLFEDFHTLLKFILSHVTRMRDFFVGTVDNLDVILIFSFQMLHLRGVKNFEQPEKKSFAEAISINWHRVVSHIKQLVCKKSLDSLAGGRGSLCPSTPSATHCASRNLRPLTSATHYGTSCSAIKIFIAHLVV